MPKFFERYPKIKIELNVANRNVVEEGYDVAIRLGTPDDSRLVARKLEDVVRGTYASPDYLKRYGVPQTPEDLHQHRCLQFLLQALGARFLGISIAMAKPKSLNFKRLSPSPTMFSAI